MVQINGADLLQDNVADLYPGLITKEGEWIVINEAVIRDQSRFIPPADGWDADAAQLVISGIPSGVKVRVQKDNKPERVTVGITGRIEDNAELVTEGGHISTGGIGNNVTLNFGDGTAILGNIGRRSKINAGTLMTQNVDSDSDLTATGYITSAFVMGAKLHVIGGYIYVRGGVSNSQLKAEAINDYKGNISVTDNVIRSNLEAVGGDIEVGDYAPGTGDVPGDVEDSTLIARDGNIRAGNVRGGKLQALPATGSEISRFITRTVKVTSVSRETEVWARNFEYEKEPPNGFDRSHITGGRYRG